MAKQEHETNIVKLKTDIVKLRTMQGGQKVLEHFNIFVTILNREVVKRL